MRTVPLLCKGQKALPSCPYSLSEGESAMAKPSDLGSAKRSPSFGLRHEVSAPGTERFAFAALVAHTCCALCWAYRTDDWLSSHRPLKIKKHGRQQASIFRYGFDYLRSIVTDLDLKSDEFLHFLQLLSRT